MRSEPVHRGIVGIDIERFTRSGWTDPVRTRLRARLHSALDHALIEAQITSSQAQRHDTGDGLLLLTSADVPTTRLLHPFIGALADQLAADNQAASPAQRLRLRLVVHAGEVIADPYGHTGEALNLAARLLDAQAGRSLLAAVAAADLIVLVSEQVYDSVVRHAYDGIDPAAWQPVWVLAKETSTRAWAHLPQLSRQPDLAELDSVPVASRHGPPSQPTPRELPREIPEFIGRQDELDQVHGLFRALGQPAERGNVVIAAIDGMGGVGKSTLAVHVAHRLADRFADGHLYLDLRGATPGLAPLRPLEALDRLLQSLGVPADRVPADTDAAAARWRSAAAGRRLLIVLDNARDTAQILPLLPASPTCGVLITSRRTLAALDGATHLHLDVMSAAQSVELLATLAGRTRIGAEPTAAVAVARLCGLLPLALRIAGARLAARPGWPVQRLADRLADQRHRLDELHDEHLAISASVQVTHQELVASADPVDQQAATAFRLLSILDTTEVGVPIAARLLDQPEQATERILERLVDAQLLRTPEPGRYRFHDLLRLYARERAALDPGSGRRAALQRAFDRYLATALEASRLLQPTDRQRAGSRADRAGAVPLHDRAGAVAWLALEQANLLAVARQVAALPNQFAAGAVQLARALYWGLDVRGQFRDLAALDRIALPVAQRLGDDEGHAELLSDLGRALLLLGRYGTARAVLEQALRLFSVLDDHTGQARALNSIGVVHLRQGRRWAAHTCCQRAHQLYRAAGDRRGEASALNNLGTLALEAGDFPAATTSFKRALAVYQQVDDRHNEAHACRNLGEAALGEGNLTASVRYSSQALRIARELDDPDVEGDALQTRGEAYRQAGELIRAIGDLEQALVAVRRTGRWHAEASTLQRLGLALSDSGRREQAWACWRGALAIFEELGQPEAETIRSLFHGDQGTPKVSNKPSAGPNELSE